MEKDLFSKYKNLQQVKRFNRREEMLKMFVERINNARVGKYKPYTPSFIAMKMSHIKTEELEFFYKKLDSSKNFSSLWHWYCCPKTSAKKK